MVIGLRSLLTTSDRGRELLTAAQRKRRPDHIGAPVSSLLRCCCSWRKRYFPYTSVVQTSKGGQPYLCEHKVEIRLTTLRVSAETRAAPIQVGAALLVSAIANGYRTRGFSKPGNPRSTVGDDEAAHHERREDDQSSHCCVHLKPSLQVQFQAIPSSVRGQPFLNEHRVEVRLTRAWATPGPPVDAPPGRCYPEPEPNTAQRELGSPGSIGAGRAERPRPLGATART